MKALKSLFYKIKAKVTLKTYQRPLGVTLITLLFINVVVLVFGSFIALAIDASCYDGTLFGGHFVEAFIANVKWMVSPNSLNSYSIRDQWQIMILAVVIIIVGMVLFSGAIIATVTTALRTFIDTKSKAKGQILVDHHFVILNWNAKVPDIIYNLMIDGHKQSIVILSNQSKEYIESEIKSLFLTKEVEGKYKISLIVKQGDPLLRTNLEDISIQKADQILIMARDDMEDGEDDNILNSDLLNLKIVLRLGSFEMDPLTQIIVETNSNETKDQIEGLCHTVSSLRKMTIIATSFNAKIGEIIAQSLVMPEIGEIYDELLSFEGSEFYSLDLMDSIDDFMKTHNQAIPVFKSGRLFVLSANEKAAKEIRPTPYEKALPLKAKANAKTETANIFIIGDNSKSEFLLENLKRSQESGEVSFSLHHYHKNENEALIHDLQATSGQKKVLILSDDQVGESTYDANVFVSLIALSKAFPKREKITYITELLDSRNLSSVRDFAIKNTIISNRMMSLLLTQLAMNKNAKAFFDRLLTTSYETGNDDDFDILVVPTGELFEMEESLHFSCRAELLRSFYEAFAHKSIVLGYIPKGSHPIFLDSDQDKAEEIILQKEDKLIYFKYQ